MAAQRISEKQFRTRRRDRRMVWVDALAFLLGLLIVTASVGGVILYEPETEPIVWTGVFFQSNLDESRTCYGYEGGDQKGQACTAPINSELQQEGEDNAVEHTWPPVTAANVTEVSFRLSWRDTVPETDPDEGCEPKPGEDRENYCHREWDYNENSTAILRLSVYKPDGTLYDEVEKANDWENVTGGTGNGVPSGEIRITVPVLEMPQEMPNLTAPSQAEAEARLNETYWQGDHEGLGEWKTIVTVVRQGGMDGTVPMNPCEEATEPEEVPVGQDELPVGEEECSFYEEYHMLASPGQGGGGMPTAYPGLYGTYNTVPDIVRDALPYTSSYEGEGQSWALSKSTRVYEAMAGVT